MVAINFEILQVFIAQCTVKDFPQKITFQIFCFSEIYLKNKNQRKGPKSYEESFFPECFQQLELSYIQQLQLH